MRTWLRLHKLKLASSSLVTRSSSDLRRVTLQDLSGVEP